MFKDKKISIELEDPTAKGKVFLFENKKFYNKISLKRKKKLIKINKRNEGTDIS